MIKLNTGPGAIDFMHELINVYFDSNLLTQTKYEYDIGNMPPNEQSQIVKNFNYHKQIDPKNRKGLVFKILDTINKYCEEENV